MEQLVLVPLASQTFQVQTFDFDIVSATARCALHCIATSPDSDLVVDLLNSCLLSPLAAFLHSPAAITGAVAATFDTFGSEHTGRPSTTTACSSSVTCENKFFLLFLALLSV